MTMVNIKRPHRVVLYLPSILYAGTAEVEVQWIIEYGPGTSQLEFEAPVRYALDEAKSVAYNLAALYGCPLVDFNIDEDRASYGL